MADREEQAVGHAGELVGCHRHRRVAEPAQDRRATGERSSGRLRQREAGWPKVGPKPRLDLVTSRLEGVMPAGRSPRQRGPAARWPGDGRQRAGPHPARVVVGLSALPGGLTRAASGRYPWPVPNSAEQHLLVEFLCVAFTREEFVRALHKHPRTTFVVDQLARHDAQVEFFFDAVLLLTRHGLVDARFFALLAAERPARATEIAELGGAILGGADTPLPQGLLARSGADTEVELRVVLPLEELTYEKFTAMLSALRTIAHNPRMVVVHLQPGSTIVRVWTTLVSFWRLDGLRGRSTPAIPRVEAVELRRTAAQARRRSLTKRPILGAPDHSVLYQLPLRIVVRGDGALDVTSDSPLVRHAATGEIVVRGTGQGGVQFFIPHRQPLDSESTLQIDALQIDAFSEARPWARSGEALMSPVIRLGAEFVLVMMVRVSGERLEVRHLRLRVSVQGDTDEESDPQG